MSEVVKENNFVQKRNRKKRKNFLANAKKYVKKGQMGRGTKIPEELYQYFVGILDAIKQGIKDPDERRALVDNVLERTKGEELNVIGNQLGSRLVELLLPYASPEDLERFIEVISPELRKLCSDNFTSHIIETLLRVSCDRATAHLQEESLEDEVPKKKKKKDKEGSYKEKHVQNCREFTLKICKYALNNLEDFVWDSYANHILRSALKCLSGITLLPGEKPKVNLLKETVSGNKGIPPHLTAMTYKVVPDDFKEIVKEFAHRLAGWPQFKDLAYQNITSALLQVLLYAVKNVDKKLTNTLVVRLLNESFAPEDWPQGDSDTKDDKKTLDLTVGDENETGAADENTSDLPPVFECESAVRLLEASLFVSRKKTYTQIYARCFINRLGRLARLPALNYTVQRLIDNCEVKEELEAMCDELSGWFAALLACGNSGVLVAAARACLRLRTRQARYVQQLEAALECSAADKQHLFPSLCLRLLPLSRVDEAKLHEETFVHIHGSVILQTVLAFQRPGAAVTGLLALPAAALAALLCDPKGCHLADAFCGSESVGAKARDKLVKALRGYYQKLALSQYGSRALEAIFQACTLEQKTRVMAELADKSSLLNSTQYGRLVASKLDVATFKQSQKKWEEDNSKAEKKKGED